MLPTVWWAIPVPRNGRWLRFSAVLRTDFQSKYLFTASLRRDGSSKLAHHWGTMPAFSAGWRISAEPFMQRFKAIEDLKIRAGWGKNGNQEGIPNYARYGLVSDLPAGRPPIRCRARPLCKPPTETPT
jgi:hypothetical protein